MKLAPTHLKRYKDVAFLFLKYGNSDIIKQGGFDDPDLSDTDGKSEGTDLAADLEKLGPTFVKIGQLLSTRSDLLPPACLQALERLQDKVSPVPFEEIKKVVEEQLGVKISNAFESFDETPLGAASLGQVHLAKLRSGRTVAVKVQRPGIREEIIGDLESLAEIASFIDAHTDFGRRYEIARIVEGFRGSLMRELDYQKEASNLDELGRNLAEFHRLRVPAVVEDYSSSRVLTMDYLAGTKITSLSGAVLVDLDGAVLAEEMFRAYLKQILVDGFFHADPHPGNLLLTPERNIAILDLGMVGRMNQRMRDQLIHLLAGISSGDGVQTAEAAMRIGDARDEAIDRNLFITSIEEIVGSAKSQNISNIQVGSVVALVMGACADAGIRIPAEISLLGKTLMNLDRVGAALSPNFDPNESIRRHLVEISEARMKDSFSTANLMGVLTETKDFLGQFPSRANRILEMVADNKLRMKVDTIDEHKLLQGLQKVANRITTGLILAALIVGSSMLARVETSFRIWGYPGLAMIFFLVACLGAGWLMVQTLAKDE
ncbi:MAG: AarF/UbiB family protein [Verrucomicrobiota bacterium]